MLVQKKAAPLINQSNGSAQAASVSKADVQSFVTSLEAAFSNLQESGWNDWFTGQLAAQESSVVQANVNSYVQSVVRYLESQGITPTSSQIQGVQDLLVSNLQTALSQVISAGLNAVEQQILGQISGSTSSEIQPDNRYVSFFEGACAGIGIAAEVLGAGTVGLFFGVVGFAFWAFNEQGMFD